MRRLLSTSKLKLERRDNKSFWGEIKSQARTTLLEQTKKAQVTLGILVISCLVANIKSGAEMAKEAGKNVSSDIGFLAKESLSPTKYNAKGDNVSVLLLSTEQAGLNRDELKNLKDIGINTFMSSLPDEFQHGIDTYLKSPKTQEDLLELQSMTFIAQELSLKNINTRKVLEEEKKNNFEVASEGVNAQIREGNPWEKDRELSNELNKIVEAHRLGLKVICFGGREIGGIIFSDTGKKEVVAAVEIHSPLEKAAFQNDLNKCKIKNISASSTKNAPERLKIIAKQLRPLRPLIENQDNHNKIVLN